MKPTTDYTMQHSYTVETYCSEKNLISETGKNEVLPQVDMVVKIKTIRYCRPMVNLMQ